MATEKKEKITRYRFLHDHIAKEAYIYDILDVISEYQDMVLKHTYDELATMDDIKKSRTIKMPFTPSRNKNISYLVESLIKNYPQDIRAIISFDFSVEPESKKLDIIEKSEYTVSINNDDYNLLQLERDKKSCENLLKLLSQFRLFNLTKLVKKSHNREHLSRIIKTELGLNFFTYKNYRTDKNNFEIVEDYAFHKENYDSVKNSLEIDKVKEIISNYSIQILRRLKNFGILNTNFNDYRDTKLDYLLNIILEDIPTLVHDKELLIIKNFNSLRSCLQKVDTIIDPLILISNDLLKCIKENGICRESDLISLFEDLTGEMISKWEKDNAEKFKIISIADENDEKHYIDGKTLLAKISELHQLILYKNERFAELDHYTKQNKLLTMDLLCNAGRKLLISLDASKNILESDENINSLKNIIKEYSEYQKRLLIKSNIERENYSRDRKKSIITLIANFFMALFKKSESTEYFDDSGGLMRIRKHVGFSKTTRDLYTKIKNNNAKVIPLSDYIELTPETEHRIDNVINEIRGNNLKIVIPIYNARKVLYPNRSQKFLISDVEYLLVDPEIIQSAESVRDYTDSLVGVKLKDEVLPGSGILAVEKYLLTLYRQKRAQTLKKRKNT